MAFPASHLGLVLRVYDDAAVVHLEEVLVASRDDSFAFQDGQAFPAAVVDEVGNYDGDGRYWGQDPHPVAVEEVPSVAEERLIAVYYYSVLALNESKEAMIARTSQEAVQS